MKRTFRSILIVLLATICVVFTALGLAACGEVKLESLKIVDPKTEFKVGDEFEVGEDFAVYAHYSDGTEKDVTEEVEFKFENGFDMDVPGNYQITVIWGGKREIYTIYVNEFDNILKKIELNTDAVKKEYEMGEAVSFEGLEIICTYENAQGNPVVTTTSSLKNFTVEIKGEDGSVIDEVFDSLGDYTITISYGSIKDYYTVTVSGVNISTVQGAVAVGRAFGANINTGTHVVKGLQPAAAKPVEYTAFSYNYEFGLNYFYLNETGTKTEDHYSMDAQGIFCVEFQNGTMTTPYLSQAAMMNGSPFAIWYRRVTYYGAENVLTALYKAAKECTNKDLVESANEAEREYSFSFSGLVFNSSNNDYYETSVKFTLGEDYAITHLEYVQCYWEYSVLGATFVTDANGHTTPLQTYNMRETVTVEQESGERTKTNPYSRDSMIVQSYDLSWNGQPLGDDGTVYCTANEDGEPNEGITIDISNIMPSTANFMYDAMYFNYEGNLGKEVNSTTMLVCKGFAANRNGNQIKIYGHAGGIWKLILRTSQTYKTITIDVTGIAPTSITSQVYNPTTNRFADATAKTGAIGGAIYFKGTVNQYANEAQTAQVTSGNSSYVTITETTVNGIKCFKFTASRSGTYTITVTSTAKTSLKCTFTFTINDLPDYSAILSGSYTVTDRLGNIYTLEFTPADADGNSGTVVITRTPTTDDDEPIPDQAQTQTLTYSVDLDSLKIVLTSVSGTNLGVDLSVNEQNKLVLEDQYGTKYVLTRSN